ncbi:MAG: nitroreductase [Hyphomonadaceae bacterium]|nr:nitroreductase [Hyphomonadaceae bacterium]
MNVTDALHTRISVRAFKSDAVPEALVREIVDVARWAPSGGNVQPWRVIAVAGAEKDALITLAKAHLPGDEGDRPIYPPDLWEPHRSRRFKVGEDMYSILGIPRENKAARLMQMARNFEFFGAPCALFFVIDRRMGHGQWAHLGMLMQSIALAAWERGVASCMQEAWARMRTPLHAHFGLGETEMVYCGMALGYADDAAPINTLRSDRAEVDEITEFKGFGS